MRTDQPEESMSTAATAQPSFLATPRGKLTLALLAAVAFLDFVDASIVNVALPSIRRDLGFSEQALQWVPSGYLLTYGGFMLLGGRAADLLGRRRILVAGTVLIGLSSLIGGFAENAGVLVGARLAQGIGAALTLPAALSILTTTFKEGSDRNTALGIWGGVGGLASAAGVLLGGLLTEGPGWRWVMFVNPLAAALVLGAIFWLISGERHRARLADFDIRGAILATGGMLLLVFTLVKAPDQGWGSTLTIAELAGAVALLAAFVAGEQRRDNPLMPLSIFRVRGLAAADATQLVAFAGLLAMFFFLTLYMQNVLGYSPIQTGAAYLPLTFAVGVAAGISSQLLPRIGTRPVIVAGALLNSSQQVGGALGLAIFSAIATSRINHLLASNTPPAEALTSGFQRALLASSIFLLASAVVALRITNTRGEEPQPGTDAQGGREPEALPQPARA